MNGADEALPARECIRHAYCRSRYAGLSSSGDRSSEHILLLRWAETTAVTLVATLAFLASYQDIQEDVFQQIIDVVGHDREPVSILLPSIVRLSQ
jgi:hypothetical protein